MYREVHAADAGEGTNQPSSRPKHQNESVYSLQTMLSSLNVDERARPAVNSYKMAIEEIPPSRNIAVFVALAKRCPAFLSVIYVYLFLPSHANQCTVMLSPLLVLEMMRVAEWVAACRRTDVLLRLRTDRAAAPPDADAKGNWFSDVLPRSMTPMEILLSEDGYSPFNRGSALQVWHNVKSSVNALEAGLTAMKCVHTAQVATDLAFNVISLAKFALEVGNKGLGNGISLILMDLFHFHLQRSSSSAGSNPRGGSNYSNRAQYSTAAVSLVENSQALSRNVSELLEDGKDENNFLSPVASFFRGLFGEKTDDSPPAGDAGSTDSPIRSDPASDGVRRDTSEADTPNADDDGKIESLEVKVEECQAEKEVASLTDDVEPIVEANQDMNQKVEQVTQSPSIPDDLELNDDNEQSDDESWTAIDARPSMDTSTVASSATVPASQDRDTSTGLSRECEVENKVSENKATTTTAARHEVIESQDNDHLKWFGAGVAIIGTVIGGIALASNKDDTRPGTGQPQGDNARRRATVEIERLDDDA